MKNILKKLVILFLIAAGIWIIWHYDVKQYISLDWLQSNTTYLEHMVNSHYTFAVLFYIAFYILCTAFALPGTFLLTMAGGYLFNFAHAVVYIIFSATTGAVLAFLASRYLVGEYIQKRYAKHLVRFNHELHEWGIYYLFLVRMLLVLPFFIVNMIAGLTKISLWTFTWTTAIGIIPGVSIYAYLGKQLRTISSVRDIFSPQIIFLFVLIIIFALLPLIIRHWKKREGIQ